MVQIINLFTAVTLLLGSANALKYCTGGGANLEKCCLSFTSQSGITVGGRYEPRGNYCIVDSGLSSSNLDIGLTNCAGPNVVCGVSPP